MDDVTATLERLCEGSGVSHVAFDDFEAFVTRERGRCRRKRSAAHERSDAITYSKEFAQYVRADEAGRAG